MSNDIIFTKMKTIVQNKNNIVFSIPLSLSI